MPDSNSSSSIAFVCMKDIGLFPYYLKRGEAIIEPIMKALKGTVGTILVSGKSFMVVNFGGSNSYYARTTSFNSGTIRIDSLRQALLLEANLDLVPVPYYTPANDNDIQ